MITKNDTKNPPSTIKKQTLVKNTKSNRTTGTRKSKPKKSGKTEIKGLVIAAVLFVAMLGGSIYLWNDSLRIGTEALQESYNSAYEKEKENAKNKWYQRAFERAEKKNHVSNEVSISIDKMEETQNLEVIKASDVEFITEDKDNNSDKVTAWLEVTGEGTFIVNLQAAEYIINNEEQHVLVRIPKPELKNITITKVEKKLFTDDFLDGDYSEGVHLAIKQRNAAMLRIQKSLMGNQTVYSNAKKVATNEIANLVKQFNTDIPDLKVDVEFFEKIQKK